MSEAHGRDASRSKQVKKAKPVPNDDPKPPCILRDGLYSRQVLLGNMNIASKTLASWIKAGLQPLEDGTREQFFYGDDVILYLKSRPGKSP